MKEFLHTRMPWFFFLLCMLHGMILLNLFIIQIYQYRFYAQLAAQQHIARNSAIPRRGTIYNRDGSFAFALNKDAYSAFIIPNELHDKQRTYTFLQNQYPQAYEKLLSNAQRSFMFIKRNISPEEKINIEQQLLTDIHFLSEPHRFYSLASASTIIGKTNIDNIGLFGIELSANEQLTRVPSKTSNQLTKERASAVYLTLDPDLQFIAYDHLSRTVQDVKAQEGAVLIINPVTGEILAMANVPSFDPNSSSSLLIDHTRNRIVTDSYELGSVMKIFVALAAFEEAVAQPDEHINCGHAKTAKVNGMSINTWKANGIISFAEVISSSNNIGMAHVAQRLGTKLYDHYQRLGFGKKTGIDFPGEQSGFINPPEKWSRRSLSSLSFGYEITATLLQLARAFSVIVNGGYLPPLHIIKTNKQASIDITPLYQSEHIEKVRAILAETIAHGTAFRAHIPGYTILGKTGTTNLLINGAYNPDHNAYTFVASIEKNEYKRVIVTFVRNAEVKNRYASQITAPLCKQIAQEMIIKETAL